MSPPCPPPSSPQPVPHRAPCAQWVLLVVMMWGPVSHCHPLGCPQPHPIVPMVSHCPPMGVPKASHCPQGDPPAPQPPTCAPRIALCAMGAADGDVGPSVTLSPSGCPHPQAVPKVSIVPLWVSPGRPIVPTMSIPPQPPTSAPRSALCAMGAAAGGDVGPSVTLSPLGCPQPHPIVPMASHCPPMGVPMAPHRPHHVPPPQPPTCAPQSALCMMGAAGGDVGP